MAGSLCVDGILTFFFIIIKYFATHIGLTLTLIFALSVALMIAKAVSKEHAGLLIGGVVAAIGLFMGLGTATYIGIIPTIGLNMLISGLGWVAILFLSRSTDALKVIGIPAYFLWGLILGAIPFGSTVSSPVVAYIGKNEALSSAVTGALIIILLVAILNLGNMTTGIFTALLGDSFCGYVNSLAVYLS
jgi:hypothetical protein